MNATLTVTLYIAIVLALFVSIFQFWRERRFGSKVIRELAALSSFITLVIFVLIYSGAFLHEVLGAFKHWGVDWETRRSVLDILRPIDEACTDVANAINGALGAADVGFRPEPVRWPAVLLVVGYLVRFLIYRFHTRRGNRDSALTGAVYWSYITAYVMVLAYLVVIAGLNAAIVLPISLALIAIVVVSVKVFIEDLGLTLRAIVKTVGTEISRAASRIAYLATEIAAGVREALAYANRFYMERIRRPLRQGIDALEARNQKTRKITEERLAKQNAQHAERFGTSASSREEHH
jgi:hypothetical protein